MDKIDELLTRRIENIYPNKKTLEKALRSGRKLTLYQGFDPSKPDLHIGHLVGLLTLKKFQELGHKVFFLIGDFTGRVGDPTGKDKARKIISESQMRQNAQTYKDQASLILPFSGKNPITIKRNSVWLSKLSFADVLALARHFTIQQLIERDMFQARLKKNREIYLNEFMYPLMQGYDSVHLKVDLEVGGSDQMFNMLAGRKLVKETLGKEKFVVTTRLLVDSKGKKISKTGGNAINLVNPPSVFFGQIMALSDDFILPCLRLATRVSPQEIEKIRRQLKKGANPMIFKKQLAFELVSLLHNQQIAQKAQAEFKRVFQKKKTPAKIATFKTRQKEWGIVDLLAKTKLASSKSEAKRLIQQGAVKINGLKIENLKEKIKLQDKSIIKVGKRKFLNLRYIVD
jgi:tyrosyl-tRNA synthetase